MSTSTERILEATTSSGFISPTTIATLLALQERLLIALLERLGNEAVFPHLAAELDDPPDAVLEAELDEDGTYTLRRRELP